MTTNFKCQPVLIAGSNDMPLFGGIESLFEDRVGNILVCDFDAAMSKHLSIATNNVAHFAGAGEAGYLDGAAEVARFNRAVHVCEDDDSIVYASDVSNRCIR